MLVGLDAGHGGSDPGAIDPLGREEKAFTLVMATLCWTLFQAKGQQVHMTRVRDIRVPNVERALGCNRAGCDAVISFHWNAASVERANGTQTYHHRDSEDGKRLAESLLEAVGPLDGDGREPWERAIAVPEPTYRDGFVHPIVGKTLAPAVLLEIEFATNEDEARRLADDGYRMDVANAVVDATLRWWAET